MLYYCAGLVCNYVRSAQMIIMVIEFVAAFKFLPGDKLAAGIIVNSVMLSTGACSGLIILADVVSGRTASYLLEPLAVCIIVVFLNNCTGLGYVLESVGLVVGICKAERRYEIAGIVIG